MFKLLNKLIISRDVKRLEILAPDIARRAKPAQFVMMAAEEKSEWVPLAIADADAAKGTISVIFREQGAATRHLGELSVPGTIFAVVGPLGRPAVIETHGTVVAVSTGIGTAAMLPLCRALRKGSNRVIGVIGAKTKKDVLLESQMRLACHKIFIATEDGSFDRKGKPRQVLEDVLKKEDVALVYAAGSTEMMEEMAVLTKARGISLRVLLYTPMVCGVGICGSCRTEVDRQIVLTCQHGPVFDGHKVNYENLKIRWQTFVAAREAGAQQLAQERAKGFGGFWSRLMEDTEEK